MLILYIDFKLLSMFKEKNVKEITIYEVLINYDYNDIMNSSKMNSAKFA